MKGIFLLLYFGSMAAYSLICKKTKLPFATFTRDEGPVGYWILTTMWIGLTAFTIYALIAF